MAAPGKAAKTFGWVCGGLISAIIVGVLVLAAKEVWGHVF